MQAGRSTLLSLSLLIGSLLLTGCGGHPQSMLNSPNPNPNPPSSLGQISGQVVGIQTNALLSGTFAALEKRDANNVDRVVQVTSTDQTGTFMFTSVPTGSFDVIAYYATNVEPYYSWMAIFDVPQQANLGVISLQPDFPAPEGFPGTAEGIVTSAPTAVQAVLWLMAPVTVNGTDISVTVPFTKNAYVSQGKSPSIPYGISTLATLPQIGVFTGNSVNYVPNTPVGFFIDAQAFRSNSTNTKDCNPAELQTSVFQIPVGPGTVTSLPTLTFTNCQ